MIFTRGANPLASRSAAMSQYKPTCKICGHTQRENVFSYGDFKCERCGQEYVYNEGHSIKLTNSQLRALKDEWIVRLTKSRDSRDS